MHVKRESMTDRKDIRTVPSSGLHHKHFTKDKVLLEKDATNGAQADTMHGDALLPPEAAVFFQKGYTAGSIHYNRILLLLQCLKQGNLYSFSNFDSTTV